MSLREEVRLGVAATLNVAASQHVSGAAAMGVPLNIVTEVYLDDGSKNYATALASALVATPSLAEGTREDMAVIATKVMQLAKPFNPARLSKPLSDKARKLVAKILDEHGYRTAGLTNGLSIRDMVKAGISVNESADLQHGLRTRFEVDGVWLGDKWYPYERVATYETDSPWYFLGIRFGGDLIQFKTVLAMRQIGIGQFIGMDNAAHERANLDQLARRQALSTGNVRLKGRFL